MALALKSSFSRFLLSGAFNTGVTYLLYLGLLNLFPYQASYAIAYVTGIVLAYVLNRAFVFKSHRGMTSVIGLPVVYAVQYVIAALILWLWVDLIGWDEKLAPLAALCVTVPGTYLLSRWVFGSNQRSR